MDKDNNKELREDSRAYRIKKKINSAVVIISNLLEDIIAIFVLIAVIISIIALIPAVKELWTTRDTSGALTHFIERLFVTVIGIEFMKMLLRPNSENILEILIFLVSRHMIVGQTTATEDFISVISVCIMIIIRRFLHETKDKNFWGRLISKRRERKKSNNS